MWLHSNWRLLTVWRQPAVHHACNDMDSTSMSPRTLFRVARATLLFPHLQIPDEAGQEGPSAVREHGSGHTFACHLTLQAQPVSSTCSKASQEAGVSLSSLSSVLEELYKGPLDLVPCFADIAKIT